MADRFLGELMRVFVKGVANLHTGYCYHYWVIVHAWQPLAARQKFAQEVVNAHKAFRSPRGRVDCNIMMGVSEARLFLTYCSIYRSSHTNGPLPDTRWTFHELSISRYSCQGCAVAPNLGLYRYYCRYRA